MNVLNNADWETGDATGWTITNGPVPRFSTNASLIFDGFSLEGAASGGGSTLEQIYPITTETNWRLAFWGANRIAGDNDDVRIILNFRDAGDVSLDQIELNTLSETPPFYIYDETTGTVPATTSYAQVRIILTKGSGGTANSGICDDVYLAFDETTTDWSEGYSSNTLARLPLLEPDELICRAPVPKSWSLRGDASIVPGGPHASLNSVRITGLNDYLLLEGLTSRIDGGSGTTAGFLFWVNLDDVTQNQGLLYLGDPTTDTDRVQVGINSNQLRLVTEVGNSPQISETVANPFTNGTWHLVELQLNNQYASLWVDGVVLISDFNVTELQFQQSIRFGTEIQGGGLVSMVGNIGDVWVLDRAVSRQDYTLPTALFPLPGAFITTYPQDTIYADGAITDMQVVATGQGTLLYQWEDEAGPISGQNTDTLQITADLANPQYLVRVAVTDDRGTVRTPWAVVQTVPSVVIPTPPSGTLRTALVWNFEDDNFTWMDASWDNGTTLDPVVCMRFQFNPGWAVTYQDQIDEGVTYQDLIDAGTTYQDLFSGGQEENIYGLTSDRVVLWDQQVVTDGLKDYFVERDKIDFSDVVQGFSSSRWNYAKQMYFHLASPRLSTADVNNFQIQIGWGDSIMDIPDYDPASVLNLQTRENNGAVKWDFRSTGRYMALKMTFNATDEIQMVGGEIDVMQTHGR